MEVAVPQFIICDANIGGLKYYLQVNLISESFVIDVAESVCFWNNNTVIIVIKYGRPTLTQNGR